MTFKASQFIACIFSGLLLTTTTAAICVLFSNHWILYPNGTHAGVTLRFISLFEQGSSWRYSSTEWATIGLLLAAFTFGPWPPW